MASVQQINEAAAYYDNLLLYQYQGLPKSTATIDLLVRQAICDLVPLDVRDAFNIDTAVGPQLDILGKYIGFSRRVLSQPPRDYFTQGDYATPLVAVTGFTEYGGGVNTTSVFLRYSMLSESFSDLDDEDYRLMLKIQIVLNATDNTLKSITEILNEFFGNELICFDAKDMTISYLVTNDAKRIALLFASQNALPKPQGVKLSGVFLGDDPASIFAVADYTQPIIGPGFALYGAIATRASTATYFDSDTWLKIASINQVRINYNPLTLAPIGALYEQAATNLLTGTSFIDSPSWTVSNCSVSPNQLLAPDGTYTADSVFGNSGSLQKIISQFYTTSTPGNYVFSIFAKAGTEDTITINLRPGDSSGESYANFNLNTFTVGAVVNTGTNIGGVATITRLANDWAKCTIKANLTAVNSVWCDTWLDGFGASTTTGSVHVWGGQLETGAAATSYIPSVETFIARTSFARISYSSVFYTNTAVYGTSVSGLEFSPDGTKMYVGNQSRSIYQFTLSTPWDVSTATYASISFTDTAGVPYEFRFNPTGTKMYRVNDNSTTSTIKEFTLSTAYDISTVTFSTQYALASTLIDPRGLCFSPDGVYMFVTEQSTDKIYRYTLSTPFLVTSATPSGELNISIDESSITGIQFDSTGNNFVIIGPVSDRIIAFNVATPWDITTAQRTYSLSNFSQDTSAQSLYLRPDNSQLFMLGQTNDRVFAYNVSYASGVNTYYDSAGLLVKSTSFNTARTSYNPDPTKLFLAPKFWWEQARTNSFLRSEDFTDAYWSKNDVTVTANAVTAPDGTLTADQITDAGGGTGTASYVFRAFTTVTNANYTISVFVKQGSYTGTVSLKNLSTDAGAANFNLTTGTVINVTGTFFNAIIQPLPNGWYRISASFKATVATSQNIAPIDISNATSGQFVYAWGAQFEDALGASSYIPTNGVIDSRSADFVTSVSGTRAADIVPAGIDTTTIHWLVYEDRIA
jgi:6-phosphogluconolactonase (cycloisomerase 2 family)